jgi:hypothetical protein
VGSLAGCSGADNPILEGSKVRGRPGVDRVAGMDEGVLCHSAVSKGEGARRFRSLT